MRSKENDGERGDKSRIHVNAFVSAKMTLLCFPPQWIHLRPFAHALFCCPLLLPAWPFTIIASTPYWHCRPGLGLWIFWWWVGEERRAILLSCFLACYKLYSCVVVDDVICYFCWHIVSCPLAVSWSSSWLTSCVVIIDSLRFMLRVLNNVLRLHAPVFVDWGRCV